MDRIKKGKQHKNTNKKIMGTNYKKNTEHTNWKEVNGVQKDTGTKLKVHSAESGRKS